MTRLVRVVVEAVIIGIVALLVAAMHAEAAVHVRVAADAPQGPVLSTNAYAVTVTTDEAVTLKTVRLLLPGHGAPPISEDVYGQPRDTDDDTQFEVLDAHGATQNGRWLTWSVDDTLLPGGVLSFRADVRLPAAEAYFQAGATATINGGASDAPSQGDVLRGRIHGVQSLRWVRDRAWSGGLAGGLWLLRRLGHRTSQRREGALRVGRTSPMGTLAQVVDATKRGAQIWAHQDTASLHTGGSATIDGRVVTVAWWMANGTDAPLTVDTERFGVRAGAAYEGSTLDPVAKVRHVSSLGIIWHRSIVLAPGERVEHTVNLTSPCGVGQVGARLRIYAGVVLAGTGDAGPHWKLPDCGGGA